MITPVLPGVRADLKALICGELSPLAPEELTDDTDLIAEGVLDSLGVAEVFSFIADNIGREVTASEHVRSTVQSVNAIVEFVERERLT